MTIVTNANAAFKPTLVKEKSLSHIVIDLSNFIVSSLKTCNSLLAKSEKNII